MIKVEWFGHSCFRISKENYHLVIDPYQKVSGYKPLIVSANEVVCTHNHSDHNYLQGVLCTLNLVQPEFKITKIPTYHDEKKGKLRGTTDIILLDDGHTRIAHFGDIGCELTSEQKEILEGVDLALVPVGGKYTINALQAKKMIEEIKPKLTIPMHYRVEAKGLQDIDQLSNFTKLFDNVTYVNSNSIELPNDVQNEIAVLQY